MRVLGLTQGKVRVLGLTQGKGEGFRVDTRQGEGFRVKLHVQITRVRKLGQKRGNI